MSEVNKNKALKITGWFLTVGLLVGFNYLVSFHAQKVFVITGVQQVQAASGGAPACVQQSDCSIGEYCDKSSVNRTVCSGIGFNCGSVYSGSFCSVENSTNISYCAYSVGSFSSSWVGSCVSGGGTSGPNCTVPPIGSGITHFTIKTAEHFNSANSLADFVYFTSNGYAYFGSDNININQFPANSQHRITSGPITQQYTDMDGWWPQHNWSCTTNNYRVYLIKGINSENLAAFVNCATDGVKRVFLRGVIDDNLYADPQATTDGSITYPSHFTIKNNAGQNVAIINDGGNLYLLNCYKTQVTSPDNAVIPLAPVAQVSSFKSSLRLTYTDENSAAPTTQYQIFRSTNSSDLNTLASVYTTVPVNCASYSTCILNYLDNGVTSGTIYYYRLKACNSLGCSAFSNQVSAQL